MAGLTESPGTATGSSSSSSSTQAPFDVNQLFGTASTGAPPQPKKYIGVQSPYWDQNPDGSWFMQPGYSRNYQNPSGRGIPDYASQAGILTPKYYEGDEYALISGMGASPETVASIQAKMAEAGLMPKQYNIGAWAGDSVNAFQQVLAYANQTTQDWQSALDQLAQSGVAGGLGKVSGGPTFTAHLSNPDDIKKAFKDVTYQLLGGQFVDPAQADTFVSTFQGQELASQRAAFNAATGGGGVVEDAPNMGTAAETQLQATDAEGIKAKRYLDMANVLGSVLGQKAPAT